MIKKIYTFIISNKRKCWYLILLFASTAYVILQRNTIGPLSVLTVVNLIFYMWLLLLLLPLFSEMEFMGLKFKEEVQKATKEVKDSVNDLKMQIMDFKISSSNANSLSFVWGGEAPSRKEIQDIMEGSELQKADGKGSINLDEIVTDEMVYLFKARLTVEMALRTFCEHINGGVRIPTTNQLLNVAITNGLLDNKTADNIKRIFTICNRGIHGEIVSEEYINFVKNVLPQVLNEISSTTHRMGYKHYFLCPRCKYAGYAEHENVCPACGFVTDDD